MLTPDSGIVQYDTYTNDPHIPALDDVAEWGWALMWLWSGSGQAAARGGCTPGVTETARYTNLSQNDSEAQWRHLRARGPDFELKNHPAAPAGAVPDSEAGWD